MTLQGENKEGKNHVDCNDLLDGGTITAGREVPVDVDARGEVHLALESRMVEFIRKGCRRHQYCCGVGGGVSGDNKGSFGYKAEGPSRLRTQEAIPPVFP